MMDTEMRTLAPLPQHISPEESGGRVEMSKNDHAPAPKMGLANDHLGPPFVVGPRKGEGLRPDFTMLLSIVILGSRAHPSNE